MCGKGPMGTIRCGLIYDTRLGPLNRPGTVRLAFELGRQQLSSAVVVKSKQASLKREPPAATGWAPPSSCRLISNSAAGQGHPIYNPRVSPGSSRVEQLLQKIMDMDNEREAVVIS